MTITTETITLQVADGDMAAYVARPESGKAPAIIVLQEAFGVNDHIKDVSRRLAQQGYLAIAPELFHRTALAGFTAAYTNFASIVPHMEAATPDAITEDVKAVYEWLLGERQVDPGHIGSIGFCMGGRASFVANAVLPLKAAVSYYGGGIAPGLLHLVADQRAPMLFAWGGLDKHITPPLRAQVAEAMRNAGKPYISTEFSDADHGFFCDARPAYNPNAAREAWALTLSFLAVHLKP
jgi:carboxymethylenebutenolidase